MIEGCVRWLLESPFNGQILVHGLVLDHRFVSFCITLVSVYSKCYNLGSSGNHNPLNLKYNTYVQVWLQNGV
jgi:hypothetical protein